MSAQNTEVPEKPAPSASARNPYIMNFYKVLVEKKGEKLDPEELKKLMSDMYSLVESLLGQNMVNAIRHKQKTLAGVKFGAIQGFLLPANTWEHSQVCLGYFAAGVPTALFSTFLSTALAAGTFFA